jgi:hypothetical protein
MGQTRSFGYADGVGCRAVELLRDGYELSMVILLPEAGAMVFERAWDHAGGQFAREHRLLGYRIGPIPCDLSV